MIMGFGDSLASHRSTWKCVACGTEVLDNEADQAEDEQLRSHIEERISERFRT